IVRHMVPRAPRRREGNRLVHCPFCRHGDSRVVDSRTAEDGASIRRRRQCPECGRRFTTVETTSLNVMKRSGAVEPFSRDKVIAGVRKACQGRPVSEDDLALLAQKVEEAVRATGVAEVDAHEVGLTILGPLRDLDEVAYLRFASVYQAFSSLEDFEAAIATLRNERSASAPLEERRPPEVREGKPGPPAANSGTLGRWPAAPTGSRRPPERAGRSRRALRRRTPGCPVRRACRPAVARWRRRPERWSPEGPAAPTPRPSAPATARAVRRSRSVHAPGPGSPR